MCLMIANRGVCHATFIQSALLPISNLIKPISQIPYYLCMKRLECFNGHARKPHAAIRLFTFRFLHLSGQQIGRSCEFVVPKKSIMQKSKPGVKVNAHRLMLTHFRPLVSQNKGMPSSSPCLWPRLSSGLLGPL